MRSIILIFILIPVISFSQNRFIINNASNAFFIKSNNSMIEWVSNIKEPLADLVSWINYESLTDTSTFLPDSSGNGNNWQLVESNALRLRYEQWVSLVDDTIWVSFDEEYTITYYASLDSGVFNVFFGGQANDYMAEYDGLGFLIRTSNSGLTTFDEIQVPKDSIIRRYTINIDSDSIEVIVGNEYQQKKENIYSGDSLIVLALTRRVSRNESLAGYLFGLNFNNEHLFSLSEGWEGGVYDCIQEVYGSIQNYSVSVWQKQNLYHHNLAYGYSNFYNAPDKQIKIAANPNGTFNNPTIAFYTNIGDFEGGLWHNSAETGLLPPDDLLQYDYNNYLFDTNGNANVIYYENMSENVGNRIFMDVSIPFKYKDIQVYNKEVK